MNQLDYTLTRVFGRDIPLSLKGSWVTKVRELSAGDVISRIYCDDSHCEEADQCDHNPRVTDENGEVDLYTITGKETVVIQEAPEYSAVKVDTDRGWFTTFPEAYAVILSHGGEQIQFALDKIETDFVGSKMDEIYAAALPEMAENGIEDTLENRLAFLSGLHAGWLEDGDEGLEKALYVLSLSMEIALLKLRIIRETVRSTRSE